MLQQKIIDRVIEEARKSEHSFQLGAALLSGNKVLRLAHNSSKTCSFSRKFGNPFPTLHAEIAVCKNVPRDVLSRLDLVVLRIKADGSLACAKPCVSCTRFLRAKSIGKIFFTNEEGIVEMMRFPFVE